MVVFRCARTCVVGGGHGGTNESYADSYSHCVAYGFAQRDAYPQAITHRDAYAIAIAIAKSVGVGNPVIRAFAGFNAQSIAGQVVKDGKNEKRDRAFSAEGTRATT